MYRLPKSRCGYTEYTCTGIRQSPVLNQPVCDNTNYDQTATARPVDNNFYNLPVGFKSVIQSTDFLDLSNVQIWKQGCCVTTYDPFQTGGLTNTFSKVKDNQDFIAQQSDFNSCIQCYTENRIQAPGILLPSAELSSFYPVPLQAVPTVALSEPKGGSTSVRGSIHSGCDGFKITAFSQNLNQVTFSVQGGAVYVQVGADQTPIQLLVPGLFDEVVQGRQDVETIQIYAVAGYDISLGEWRAVLDWKSKNNDFYSTTPKRWMKLAQIGTIHYQSRSTVDVVQGQCSPADLRDWVSEQSIPSTVDGDLFVFSMRGGSAKKQWLPVKDCG